MKRALAALILIATMLFPSIASATTYNATVTFVINTSKGSTTECQRILNSVVQLMRGFNVYPPLQNITGTLSSSPVPSSLPSAYPATISYSLTPDDGLQSTANLIQDYVGFLVRNFTHNNAGYLSNTQSALVATPMPTATASAIADGFSYSPGPLPTGYHAFVFNTGAAAPYVVTNNSGVTQIGEPSGATTNDVMVYEPPSPLATLDSSYQFVYNGTSSIIEPFLMYSTAPTNSGYGPIQGLKFDITAAGASNNAAGNITKLQFNGTSVVSTFFARMRTEPYHYITGHLYTVTTIVENISGNNTIAVKVSDATPGYSSNIMWDYSYNTNTSAYQLYPGVINATGGVVAINSFNESIYGQANVASHVATRGYDFVNLYEGVNASHTTTTPSTDITSQAILQYIPILGTKLIRISTDIADGATENTLASFGVQTDCLTSAGDSNSFIESFAASLTNGCKFVELADEPNGNLDDANYATDLPAQAESLYTFRAGGGFSPTAIASPLIVAPSYVYGTGTPNAFATAAPLYAAYSPNPLDLLNVHDYSNRTIEGTGYGGMISVCGPSVLEDCGYAGGWIYNQNLTNTVAPGFPVMNTEGGGSYGSYPGICGGGAYAVDLPEHMAYLERGLLFEYKAGHRFNIQYKFIDDSGCSDGFGDYGYMSVFKYNDGTVQSIVPKPAYSGIAGMNRLLNDTGTNASTYVVQPLSYGISGMTPDIESVLLGESDGSYRLVLWSDKELWNWSSGTSWQTTGAIAPTTTNVVVTMATGTQGVQYTENTAGAWSAGSTQSGLNINAAVTQYPTVIALYPAGSTGTPAPAPTGLPTPGPTETPTAAPPSPMPTSTSAVYSDSWDADPLGTPPPSLWMLNNNNGATWAVTPGTNNNTAPNELTDSTQSDYMFFTGAASATGVETEFTFLPVSTTAAGVSGIIHYGSNGGSSQILINLSNGAISRGSVSGGYTSVGTLTGGFLGSYASTTTKYAVKYNFVNETTLSLKVWPLATAEPTYGPSLTLATVGSAYSTGFRNYTGGTIHIDDWSAAFNGAPLPTLPGAH